MRHDDYRDVPLTLAVALALWAGAVAAGTGAGVFLRVPEAAYLALAAFAAVFATGVVSVDARVRGWLAARGAAVAGTAALGLAGMLVAGGATLAQGREIGIAAAPWAPILLFGVPVTLASAVSAIRSVRRGWGMRPGSAVEVAGD
jgi:hypothetical protein